jgi:hypothetical protein
VFECGRCNLPMGCSPNDGNGHVEPDSACAPDDEFAPDRRRSERRAPKGAIRLRALTGKISTNEELSELVPRSARSDYGITQNIPSEDGQCSPQGYRVDASTRNPIIDGAGKQK